MPADDQDQPDTSAAETPVHGTAMPGAAEPTDAAAPPDDDRLTGPVEPDDESAPDDAAAPPDDDRLTGPVEPDDESAPDDDTSPRAGDASGGAPRPSTPSVSAAPEITVTLTGGAAALSAPDGEPAKNGTGSSASGRPTRQRRTLLQRLTIAAVFLAAIACFAAGSALYAAQRIVEDRNIVLLDEASTARAADQDATFTADTDGGDPDTASVIDEAANAPVETFPQAEPEAKNFLITGADNNSCVDPDSPFAGAFGDRSSFGERSDTIMMWRINPSTSRVAVLSFPRDLWVTISGRSSEQRINVAYRRDEPQRLIDTIEQNFGIPTDHFIQVDFCAFKILVDAVDGVAVPFEHPVRDTKTGLNVTESGCFTFTGDHALAYVRSRSLQEFRDGEWIADPTSDRGRISRQQDFIRRTADSLLAAGAFNPAVVRAVVETSDDYIVNDSELTIRKMLEFAGVLRNVDTNGITTYQIEASDRTIQGNDVLIPRLGGENMQSILRLFRGEARLASAPQQIFDAETTTTVGTLDPSPSSDTVPSTTVLVEPGVALDRDGGADDAANPDDADDAAAGSEPDGPVPTLISAPTTTLPIVDADDITFGIVPDASVRCR